MNSTPKGRFYFDTEFIEGKQSKKFLGIKYGETKPTIDLISIGIVDYQTGETLYLISKDFNLDEAWNRVSKTTGSKENNSYWIRENVLKPIFKDLAFTYSKHMNSYLDFNKSNMRKLLNFYGKTNKEITLKILEMTNKYESCEFYGYYCDYDWVVFCQLFGTMMDLPKNYPYFCIDTKQLSDFVGAPRFEQKGGHVAIQDALEIQKHHKFILDFISNK